MKKYFLMALSVLMASTFVACGDDDDDNGKVPGALVEAVVDIYVPVFEEQLDYFSSTAKVTVNGVTVEALPVEKGKYSSKPNLSNNPIEGTVTLSDSELVKEIKYCKVFTGKYKKDTKIEASTEFALTGKYGSHEKEIKMLSGVLIVAHYDNVSTPGSTDCSCLTGIYTDEENLKGICELFNEDQPKSSIVI